MSDVFGAIAEGNRKTANRNAEVAEHNAELARAYKKGLDQWVAYAEKLNAKLAAVERERDALREERDNLAALVGNLARAANGKSAAPAFNPAAQEL